MSRSSSSFGRSSRSISLPMRKVEISRLSEDELKYVLLFRPGAKDDPSYRRVSIPALEYMKDIKTQLVDDVKNQTKAAIYACEPPDTDTSIITGNNSSQKVIDKLFYYRVGRKREGRFLAESCPTTPSLPSCDPHTPIEATSTPIPSPLIGSYSELIREASKPINEQRNVPIARIRTLDLEPLFDHMTQRQPAPFMGLQDVFLMIRNLDPTITGSGNYWSPVHNSSIQSDKDVELVEAQGTWEKNFTFFIHTANTIMGDFHGTLPFYWLNNIALHHHREEMVNFGKLPNIPTLQELDKSDYSISAFQRIKYGIRVEGKNVSVQILSLLDFRYRGADMTDRGNPVFKYYRDSIIKLSKLVPNKRSFDVAVEVGMIPADMTSLIDFTWWTNNVIKVGREVEANSIGKETYDLFVQLNADYYSFLKSVARDANEQLKYNPVQYSLNIVNTVMMAASLVFAVTGVVQVLQGFCVWKEYC